MILRIILTLWLLLLPLAVSAQQVSVRSGEHDGFTRLVVYFPPNVTSDIIEGEDQVEIIPSRPLSFDLSSVFSRIARTRVASVRQDAPEGSLHLQLACDCPLRREVLVGNVLVLDILDPKQPSGSQPNEISQTVPARVVFPPVPQRSLQDARRISDSVTAAFPSASETSADRIARLAEIENAMVQQIARTATQGILDIGSGGIEAPMSDKMAQPSQPEDPEPTQMKKPPKGGTRMHTSLLDDRSMEDPVTADGQKCLSDAQVDIAAWAGEADFLTELGHRRNNLIGEFDTKNATEIKALARFYIAYGFGAEARNTLKMLDESGMDVRSLRSMAAILDFGFDPDPSPFRHQSDCENSVALWSILSQERLPPDETVAAGTVLRSLNSLPQPLREVLGLELANRLIAAGHTDLSQGVLRILERSGVADSPKHSLVEGKLELVEGSQGPAEAALIDAMSGSNEASPEALILLVEEKMRRDTPVEEDLAELLGAYVLQYRDSPIASDLMRVEIQARASAGQFDTAMQLLNEREAQGLSVGVAKRLRNIIAKAVLDRGAESDAIRIGFTMMRDHPQDLNKGVAMALSDRFVEAGFPDLAMEFGEGLRFETTQDLRMTRARAALASGRPQRAEAELIGLETREAAEIRARSQEAAGDFLSATETYDALSQVDAAEENALRSGDWTRLQNSDDALRAALSTLMRDEDTLPDETAGQLAQSRRLLQDTAASRQTIQDLLERYRLGPSD